MDQMEKIETLREKTGCTYTEAKAALEASNGDLLDALCWLEQRGKSMVAGAYASTEQQPEPEQTQNPPPQEESAFAKGCKIFWDGIVELIRRGNRNRLVMRDKHGQQTLSLPVTLFVVLLVAAFWVILPLMIVGLFFGCRFACEVCRRERPRLLEVAPGHLARCHRPDVTGDFRGLIQLPGDTRRKEDADHA